ncbi:hypothetical protein CFP65_3294 [Kitasatospora sp. MMS16-BH015]|uniref:hypothetical protein n=1 Tax=Kitasatospora sp. MMS16-BH015 TaxID=2018025 RepID=UPI000CA182E4|nr:hypothetical protein [Kitasatospora sp. MMS16-BH015]AUG78094.1 hypothetical protein CFP65_3294 [Kitasatospora sp. MMS16-BH015]
MPAFLYTGPDDGRYYPTLGITPTPGQTYELAADPGDGAWTPAPSPPATRARAATTTTATADPAAEPEEVTASA